MNKATESYGLSTRFDTTWITAACWIWLALHILALLFGYGIFMNILYGIVTIPMLWIIRKNVLEFIDIKSSVGQ